MKIVFMGTPQAAVPSLERLIADGHEIAAVYTQPDRPSGRGNKIAMPPVKEAAISHGIEVVQPQKIRTDEAIEQFRSFQADAAVVVAYGRILPTSFLEAFRYGAINLHFSLLPKYRGAAPVNWAIVYGESETGVTTMQMDAGLDTGPILMQEAVPIVDGETSIELMSRLSVIGADLLSRTIGDIDSLRPQSQDHSAASLAPIMKKDDGLIDWTRRANEISNRVRGFQPFPTSFTYLDGSKLTIWATAIEDGTNAAPGTVVEAKGDRLVVACGESTAVSIKEIQAEGKRRVDVRDFLNGSKIAVGMILG